MAVDSFAKRMAVAGIPHASVGVNVFPGTTSTTLGRAAAAWNYAETAPGPPVGGNREHKLILGHKVTFATLLQLGQ